MSIIRAFLLLSTYIILVILQSRSKVLTGQLLMINSWKQLRYDWAANRIATRYFDEIDLAGQVLLLLASVINLGERARCFLNAVYKWTTAARTTLTKPVLWNIDRFIFYKSRRVESLIRNASRNENDFRCASAAWYKSERDDLVNQSPAAGVIARLEK